MQRCLAKTTVGTVIAGNEDDDEEGESTCGNMQEHIGGTDVPIMTCGKCGGKTCVVCQVEMQLGVACHGAEEIAEGCEVEKEEDAGEDNDKDEQEALKQLELKLQEQKQREKEIELSESWLKEHAKQCPGCASWIQKTEGCDHMSCEYFILIAIDSLPILPTPTSVERYIITNMSHCLTCLWSF